MVKVQIGTPDELRLKSFGLKLEKALLPGYNSIDIISITYVD